MDTHELRGCRIRTTTLTSIRVTSRMRLSVVRRRRRRRRPNNQRFFIRGMVHPVTGRTDTKRVIEVLEERRVVVGRREGCGCHPLLNRVRDPSIFRIGLFVLRGQAGDVRRRRRRMGRRRDDVVIIGTIVHVGHRIIIRMRTDGMLRPLPADRQP